MHVLHLLRMRTIPHRELRNNSTSILEAVRNGEIIEVTNNGQPAAIMVPPGVDRLQLLALAGRVRRATQTRPFGSARRIVSERTTEQMLAEVRDDR